MKVKARSKGQKRRARLAGISRRPGRPRQEGRARDANGRILQTNAEKTDHPMATVIDMRIRRYQATEKNARRPEWGYVLGRIYMDGHLGAIAEDDDRIGRAEARLEAGNRYATAMARYYGLTGVQFPSARAQDLFAIKCHLGEVSARRAEAAREAAKRMMSLEGALLKCITGHPTRTGRNVATTVKNVCVMDLDEARTWPPHMMGLLRQGLDVLVWEFGLGRADKQA